jgi:hypothetical protein
MTMETRFKIHSKSRAQRIKIFINNLCRGAGYAIRN